MQLISSQAHLADGESSGAAVRGCFATPRRLAGLCAAAVVSWGVLLGGCDKEALQPSAGALSVVPAVLDLGTVRVGEAGEGEIRVTNQGRAPFEVAVLESGPVSVSPAELWLDEGVGAALTVRWRPERAGPFTAALVLEATGRRTEVQVRAVGVEGEDCAFLEEGAPCSAPCLESSTCVGGKCVGAARVCDDGNPCTVDVCDPAMGCTRVEGASSCPPGSGPCMVAVCDFQAGCSEVAVQDGVSCGPSDCTTARVCVSGTCVERAVPEGAPCGEDSPCQEPGICRAGACDQPGPNWFMPLWSRGVGNVEPGVDLRLPLVADESGETIFAVGDFVDAVAATGRKRWRITAGLEIAREAMVVGGHLLLIADESVSARRLTDGQVVWRLDVASQMPGVESGRTQGGPFSVSWVAEADDSALWLAVDDANGGQRLLRVSTESGGIVSTKQLSELTSDPVVDADGTLFVRFGSGSAAAVGELDPETGAPRWNVPAGPDSRLLGTLNGQVLRSGEASEALAHGASAWQAAVRASTTATYPGLTEMAAVTDGKTIWLRTNETDQLSSQKLTGLDFENGEVLWSVPLGLSTQPILTQRGTVLVVTQDLPQPGSTNHCCQTRVREFDRHGRETMHCPLWWWGELVADPVLIDGQLVFAQAGGSIRSYLMPGRREARGTWTNIRGNSQRTRRVH